MAKLTLGEAVERLNAFLAARPLTAAIAELEQQLTGADAGGAKSALGPSGVDHQLLHAAVTTRRELGRINDLIHAAAIALVLPRLLQEGERITNRPSLAAGNDPSRPFDLETNMRVAEFKLSRWRGSDAARKRQTFKDLVHLAADESGRRAELFVVGELPERFLRRSKSSAAWGLDRFKGTQELFIQRFGPLDTTIASFTNGPAAHTRTHNQSGSSLARDPRD